MALKRSVILLITFSILLFSGCKKYNRDLREVIDVLNNNFNRINNYVADYSIKEGNELTFIGKITFIKLDITRFEIFNPQTKKLQCIIYSNNDFEWTYFPQWNEAIKERLVKKANKKYNFIYHSVPSGEEISSLVYKGKKRIEQEDFFELIAIMGTKGKGSLTNINTFLVDADTGCIRKFSYRDHKTGKEVIYEFGNYRINTPINKQDIELNLPSDVRITEIN